MADTTVPQTTPSGIIWDANDPKALIVDQEGSVAGIGGKPIPQTTDDKALDAVRWLIASVLDYPSVYMGGPSMQSRKKAERIIEALDAEGWTLTQEKRRG